MKSRVSCAACDGPIRFVPYTNEQIPGKLFCSVHCICRYEQAKKQHDQALRLQPVTDDQCYCHLCDDDG